MSEFTNKTMNNEKSFRKKAKKNLYYRLCRSLFAVELMLKREQKQVFYKYSTLYMYKTKQCKFSIIYLLRRTGAVSYLNTIKAKSQMNKM